MDFKGHFALTRGRCHPLTVIDDHSRFAIALEACGNERGTTVQTRLTAAFRRYGLPARLLMDNGSPWGSDRDHPYTPLGAWLIRLGVTPPHGRPYHPRTQGKNECFNRSLKAEVLRGRLFEDLDQAQRSFEDWCHVYNCQRPHDALDLDVPASRYSLSPRPFP